MGYLLYSRTSLCTQDFSGRHYWSAIVCLSSTDLYWKAFNFKMGINATGIHAHNLWSESIKISIFFAPSKESDSLIDIPYILTFHAFLFLGNSSLKPLFLNLAVADFVQSLGLMHNCESIIFLIVLTRKRWKFDYHTRSEDVRLILRTVDVFLSNKNRFRIGHARPQSRSLMYFTRLHGPTWGCGLSTDREQRFDDVLFTWNDWDLAHRSFCLFRSRTFRVFWSR